MISLFIFASPFLFVDFIDVVEDFFLSSENLRLFSIKKMTHKTPQNHKYYRTDNDNTKKQDYMQNIHNYKTQRLRIENVDEKNRNFIKIF